MQAKLQFLLNTAASVFGSGYPVFPEISLPLPHSMSTSSRPESAVVSALWTKDGLRPRWNNLSVIADDINGVRGVNWWRSFALELRVPLVLLFDNMIEEFVVLSEKNYGDPQKISPDNLSELLIQKQTELFSPRNLASVRNAGLHQLSFMDLESQLTEDSLSFHFRYRVAIDKALQRALNGALSAQSALQEAKGEGAILQDVNVVQSIVNVSIAYLAARILEDKGFFDNRRLLIDNPRDLIGYTVTRTNGFFSDVYLRHLPLLDDTVLLQLASHLGNSVSFSLIDHRDVGHIYESAIQHVEQQKLPLSGLEQHYTPLAIAERMLDLLPLERIRPEQRVIFDPAAGSGSLLLSSTRRLASMSDVSGLENNKRFLESHVLGNDLDSTADLVTKLRYTLVQESFGREDLFPTPEYFGSEDYEDKTAWELPLRPSVIVANPPFEEDSKVQRAVRFVQTVTNYLRVGDQFAFVLPHIFLTGTTHGWSEARGILSEKCRILETWQLPEGAIGLSARQPTSVVLGVCGDTSRTFTIARGNASGARTDTIRDSGFLGQAWLATIAAGSKDWKGVVAPPIQITVPMVPLGDLYYFCVGVTHLSGVPPVATTQENVPLMPYWKNSWRTPGSLWANSNNIPAEEKYIRYSQKYLKYPSYENEWVFKSKKLIIGRVTNRNARYPLAACLDTEGFYPNNNVFCIVPRGGDNAPLIQSNISSEWSSLTSEEQLLWLLGIMASNVAADISLSERDARHISSHSLRRFPLPRKVDARIIEVVRQILEIEKVKGDQQKVQELRTSLDLLAEEAYGNPYRLPLVRTGQLPELSMWLKERGLPSVTTTGQVRQLDLDKNQVQLYLDGLLDDITEEWIPLPPETPGWALDGTAFKAELSSRIRLFTELVNNPQALRGFRHSPRPYLTVEELQDKMLRYLGGNL